jgi:hypothetical protein
MMMKPDVYTKAIVSLKKTQDALLNEISIADGRSRVHAPTFYYVSEAIKQIKELQLDSVAKAPVVVAEVKEVITKPVAKKATAKK